MSHQPKGEHRIVICIDVCADTPREAYHELYNFMEKYTPGSALDWESTDEWYTPDGERVPQDEIEDARLRGVAKRIIDTAMREGQP